MTQEWIEKRQKEMETELSVMKQDIIDKINGAEFLTKDFREYCLERLEMVETQNFCTNPLESLWLFHNLDFLEDKEDPKILLGLYDRYKEWHKSLDSDRYVERTYEAKHISRYLDSKPKEFDGDIIITDPCYVMNDESKRDDWAECGCGEEMGNLGFTTYMTRDTLCGDWSCTTFNSDTKEPIGEFCADAGMVSVFLLDEILHYNPNYTDHIKKDWVATHIKDFKGTVQFVIEQVEGTYDYDTPYHKKGEKWEDYSVHVVGKGINKTTGEPLNFRTSQTGF